MHASETRAARLARLVLAGAAVATFATSAAAEGRLEDVPSSYPALQKMKPVEVMHMIDKEKKGYVTREEFMKFQEALFDRLDKNRDRRLDEVEFTDRG